MPSLSLYAKGSQSLGPKNEMASLKIVDADIPSQEGKVAIVTGESQNLTSSA